MGMKQYSAEILCVGTELLLGDIINTNAVFLSRELSKMGISVYHQTVVGDNPDRLREAFCLAWSRSDIVITSGGLGPTYDDLTKEIICQCLELPLVADEPSMKEIENYFARRGREMTENNRKQAMVPQGGIALRNPRGTAPGIYVETEEKRLVMLPGPPKEFEPLFLQAAKPLLEKLSGKVYISDTIYVYGLGEASSESRLLDLMTVSKNPTLAPYAKEGEVHLRVTSSADTEEEAHRMNRDMIAKVRERIGDYIYGINAVNLETVLAGKLMEKGCTLSVAESCTGGLLSKRMTDIPGISSVYLGGVCTYTNEMKVKVLGVRQETLERYGAVSEEVAGEMASGIASVSGSDLALSITGIAGPGGGRPEKPVGTVCLGVWYPGKLYTERVQFGEKASREYIRTLSASKALFLGMAAVDEKLKNKE